MERIISRYTNKETGLVAFKKLCVRSIDGMFRVVHVSNYGYGAEDTITPVPSIKPYKTQRGAEKALDGYKLPQYRMTLIEGLMQEGKI
ncbi:MAG: hypothetical protein E7L15_17625 [Citrobacter portucalensis]|nr:hypothetical protein [Citrobacter portucalensis]